MNTMRHTEALALLLRPMQWIKNFFVFAPIIFGGALFDVGALTQGLVAFFAFSFAASSIYCFNDIHDVADDRRHPEKCHRPIASGAVSVGQGFPWRLFSMVVTSQALSSRKINPLYL